ncbi:unnamed protein product [Agarophyton chilense]
MAGPHAGNRNRPAYSGQARFRFPKQVIELFAPRKPIEFKPPPRKRKLRRITGLAALVHKFGEQSKENRAQKDDPLATDFETPAQRRRRVREEKVRKVHTVIAKARAEWDPSTLRDGDEKTDDAVRTLFVGNVAYTTVEARLRDEFEAFGPVKMVLMPKDKEGIPRGYAFIEFKRERDVEVAYRKANGIKVDGRRLMVDVERGRTVKGWYPNRLDGPNNSAARRTDR